MIGVFDSGFGGLTIFKEIQAKLPDYDYIYLGDNARAPYGHHTQSVIYEYTRQAVDYLFNQGCDLIILACNTASSEALRTLQQEYLPKKYPGKNVLGVVRPLAEAASQITKNNKVAVIGTVSTIESQAYIRELKTLNNKIEVYQQACPLLVPLVEESQESTPEAKSILHKYLESIHNQQLDVLILGCTHYGFFTEEISNYFGESVIILNSGEIVADKLVEYLQRHPEFNSQSTNPQTVFLTTDDNLKFNKAATKYFGKEIKAKTIKLI